MAACNPSSLLADAKCFSCLSKKELQAVIAQLLCNISSDAPKIYRAVLSQSGLAAPVPSILENTLGAVPTWTRISAGQYYLTLTGAFPQNKTFVQAGQTSGATFGNSLAQRGNDNIVSLTTYDVDLSGPTADPADGLLVETSFLVMVYP